MSHQLKILIIEDDPRVVELVSVYLEKEGFQVEIAGDGETGLSRAEEQRPDLVLKACALCGGELRHASAPAY